MKTALAILVAILVIGGGYLFFVNKTQAPVTTTETATTTSVQDQGINPPAATTGTQTTGAHAPVTTHPTVPTSALKIVTYNGSTFSPAKITIKEGDTVKFVDTTSAPMWVASNAHPTHTAYSGTSVIQHCPDTNGTAFDQCTPGTSYTFTFLQVGSWGYHNHLNKGSTGTIIVTK